MSTLDRTDLGLLHRWTATRFRLMLRTPRATFFTFAFPLMFLLLFNALNSGTRLDGLGDGAKVAFAQWYTPSIAIFGLTTACYSGLIFGLSAARDNGLLKRVQGTPLPMWTYLAAWMGGVMLVGLASVVLMFAVAIPVFGVDVYPSQLPAAIVSIVLGAACLSALGLAVASLVRTADQATPVAQLTLLPLSFISGVFYPLDGAPDWLVKIADVFPLHHLVLAFDGAFQAGAPHAGWSSDLWPLVTWTAIGLIVATRRFRAEPATGDHSRRGLRRAIAVR
jgi:ABC-2 type transport system permease protein